MASTTLINAQTESAKSSVLEISGTNTIVVRGAEMKDRVEVFINDTPSGVIDSPPWAKTLNVGTVNLRINTRNRSGNPITVTNES